MVYWGTSYTISHSYSSTLPTNYLPKPIYPTAGSAPQFHYSNSKKTTRKTEKRDDNKDDNKLKL